MVVMSFITTLSAVNWYSKKPNVFLAPRTVQSALLKGPILHLNILHQLK